MRILLVAALLTLSFWGHASAQEIPYDTLIEEPDPSVRLESWLRVNADEERSSLALNWVGTGLLLAAGPAEIVAAGFLGGNDRSPQWLGSTMLVTGGITTLGAFMRLGIQLFDPSPHRDRLARFERARASGEWNDTLRATFEEEWRSSVRSMRRARNIAGIAAIGSCAVGAGLLIVASQTNESSFRMHDEFLGIGIAFAATGCVNAPFMFLRTEMEKRLATYDEGMRLETESDVSLGVTPVVGPSQLGVAVTGTF